MTNADVRAALRAVRDERDALIRLRHLLLLWADQIDACTEGGENPTAAEMRARSEEIQEGLRAAPAPPETCEQCGRERLSGNHREGWKPGSGVYWHEFVPSALPVSVDAPAQDGAQAPTQIKCAYCAKAAACFGVYESMTDPLQPACNDCCGHGNEDGWCLPIGELFDYFNKKIPATPRSPSGDLRPVFTSLQSGLRAMLVYLEGHDPRCNGDEDGPCDCGYTAPDRIAEALLEQVDAVLAGAGASPEKFAFDNGSGMTEMLTVPEMIAELQRLGRRCEALAGASHYENVWLLLQRGDAESAVGVRGVFGSQAAAEAEIAAIRNEHPDLQRQDFWVQVERIRAGVSRSAGEPPPLVEAPTPEPQA